MTSIEYVKDKLINVLSKEFKLVKVVLEKRSVYITFVPSNLTKNFITAYTKHFMLMTNSKDDFMFWNSYGKKGMFPKTLMSTESRVSGNDSIKFVIKSLVRSVDKMMLAFLNHMVKYLNEIYIPSVKSSNSLYIHGRGDDKSVFIGIDAVMYEFKHLHNIDNYVDLLLKISNRIKYNYFDIRVDELSKEQVNEMISMMEGSIQDTANELKILYRLIGIFVNQFDLTEASRLLQRSMTPLHKKIDLGIITSLSITKGDSKLVDNEKPKISLSERLRDAQLR